MVMLALPVGVLIGLSLGALGAGGSILAVPALVYLLGQDPHQATTASLVIVGAAAVAGAFGHARAGRVRLGPGVVFGVLGAAGSVVGSRASAAISPDVLLLGFAGLMVAAAVAMLHRARRPTDPAGAPARSAGGAVASRVPVRRVMTMVVAASVVGLLTGFFGVGGGFVVVPALVLAVGYDTATAVGTSLVVIAVNSAVALVTRLGTQPGGLDWPLVAVFLGAAIVGVLVGNRVASRVEPHRLTTAFAVMLIAVAIYTGGHSILGLV